MLICRLFDSISLCRAGRTTLLLALAGLFACASVQVRYPDGSTEYKSKDECARYVEVCFATTIAW